MNRTEINMCGRKPGPYLALATLLLAAISAIAQATGDGTITGVVETSDGKPVAGVRVELLDVSSHHQNASTVTDSDGSFRLYHVTNGQYEVIAQSGVVEARQSIDVFDGQANV